MVFNWHWPQRLLRSFIFCLSCEILQGPGLRAAFGKNSLSAGSLVSLQTFPGEAACVSGAIAGFWCPLVGLYWVSSLTSHVSGFSSTYDVGEELHEKNVSQALTRPGVLVASVHYMFALIMIILTNAWPEELSALVGIFPWCRLSVLQDEKRVLDMDGGESCTTLWKLPIPLNCILNKG